VVFYAVWSEKLNTIPRLVGFDPEKLFFKWLALIFAMLAS